MSARQLGLYAGLALLVVTTGWFLFTQETGLQRPTASAKGADAFVEDIDLKVLNEAGQLEYRVIARRMLHYPGDERFTLEQPDIKLHQSNGDTWHIVSERGETTEAEVRAHVPRRAAAVVSGGRRACTGSLGP